MTTPYSPELLKTTLPLVEAMLDGALDAAEQKELEQVLERDEAAIDLYAELLALHALLKRDLGGKDALPAHLAVAAPPMLAEPTPLRWRVAPLTYRIGLAAAIALLWLGLWTTFGAMLSWRDPTPVAQVKRKPAPTWTAAAHVVACEQVEWTNAALTLAPGDQLPRGWKIDLRSGRIELRYPSGALVQLTGPVQFVVQPPEILNAPGAGYLAWGELAARVPPAAHGFLVQAERMAVVDLGTEFTVRVASDTSLDLSVTDGRVAAFPLRAGKPCDRHRMVTSGQTLQVSQSDEVQLVQTASRQPLASNELAPPLCVDFGDAAHDPKFGPAVQPGFAAFHNPGPQAGRSSSPVTQSFASHLGRDQRVDVTLIALNNKVLVWRDRGQAQGPWGALIEDFVNADRDLDLVISNLREGDYTLTTFHYDLHKALGTIELRIESGPNVIGGPQTIDISGAGQMPTRAEVRFHADGVCPIVVHLRRLKSPYTLINGFVLEGPAPETALPAKGGEKSPTENP